MGIPSEGFQVPQGALIILYAFLSFHRSPCCLDLLLAINAREGLKSVSLGNLEIQAWNEEIQAWNECEDWSPVLLAS